MAVAGAEAGPGADHVAEGAKHVDADTVGWSDGGIIGLELTIHHPDRLNEVVACAANFDPSGVRLDIGQNASFTACIARAAQDYRRLNPQPERWGEFRANIEHMWATEPNYSEAQLKSITTPILTLDGEKEEAIDLNQKLMALLIPGAKLVLMSDAGHFAMFQQPAEFSTGSCSTTWVPDRPGLRARAAEASVQIIAVAPDTPLGVPDATGRAVATWISRE